jgi:CarD family transcriptional regulator
VALPTSPSNFNLGAILQFDIGDKVIYPNHGLGVIERIEDKTILGTTCGFYSLRMATSDTTVLVPVDNVGDVGLRRAIDDSEVKKLFTLLGNGKIENHQNWKGRFKDNSDKMRTGSIYDVVDVLKSLNHLSQSKNLSFREKRMLDRAKFLVISEISEVINESDEVVEERVEKALERCLVNRIRLLEKAKTAKKKTAKAKRASSKKASSRAAASRTAAAS